ncbi:amidohydrolase family protein [Amycolatopsis suaedae]|uniref:Twin-arginine translocation signal domain-containing protein n=1 Tax=Amycolatopsis suaedae TaxID=2510978 RepID=A0A4Q7J4M8_9PSEU|nr:amidohydrolase family protein [Amycolatopsis suaedae]RZQ62520.1 twin-arginine translocation signal domain-containing protein [Amycolatopsis suaedae]
MFDNTSRRDFLRWLSVSGAALAVPGLLSGPARAASPDVTVITHATLIDGTGARPLRDATVIVVGGHVVWAGAHGHARIPRGATIIDARGKFVLPGLWDMHTHGTAYEDISIPLYLVNGVTGVREMGGFPWLHAIRERIESGELLGPRMVIASNFVDGPISLMGENAVRVSTVDEARAAVRAEAEGGADLIKVYSYLEAEPFAAVADEARRLGLPFGGHVPYRSTLPAASDLGQRCFEHLYDLPLSVSRLHDRLRAELARTPLDPADPLAFFLKTRELDRLAAAHYDPRRGAAVFARLVRNGSWVSPTLTVNRIVSSPASDYVDDPRLEYLPGYIKDPWKGALARTEPKTPEQIARQRAYFTDRLRLVGRLHRAGVGVLGGTDCTNPYVVPGFAVHDELELLVRAGLSPMAAIQTMTRDAARFLGQEATAGTVAPGKVADLVVLDADPLADIRNTAKVNTVVVRGRVITADERLRMLAAVKEAAGRPAPPASAAALTRPACACF